MNWFRIKPVRFSCKSGGVQAPPSAGYRHHSNGGVSPLLGGFSYRNRRESGAAMLIFIVILVAIMSILTGTYIAEIGGMNIAANHRREQNYVDSVAAQLKSWYATHPLDMDQQQNPQMPSGCQKKSLKDCLLAAAGINRRYGIKLYIGARQQASNGYDYRKLAIWIPKPDLTGSKRDQYSSAHALVSAQISGRAIEQHLWVKANHELAQTASQWTSAYAAWIDSNGNIRVDWFQPPSCGPYGDNKQMNCASSWTPIQQTGFALSTGVDAKANNPWGLPVQLCNAAACGAQDQSVPYSALLRTQTPWGGQLEQTIVEPLTAG